jgi:cellobiose-specific phosphotransferase system component IIC
VSVENIVTAHNSISFVVIGGKGMVVLLVIRTVRVMSPTSTVD